MTAADFIQRYEHALSTQHWSAVDPLIHDDACVTFSDGTVHQGKSAVRQAFERNFSLIKGEQYRISNIHWITQRTDLAVFLFDFHWTGRIEGRNASGSGRGTSVLVDNGTGWLLLAEHLGPNAS